MLKYAILFMMLILSDFGGSLRASWAMNYPGALAEQPFDQELTFFRPPGISLSVRRPSQYPGNSTATVAPANSSSTFTTTTTQFIPGSPCISILSSSSQEQPPQRLSASGRTLVGNRRGIELAEALMRRHSSQALSSGHLDRQDIIRNNPEQSGAELDEGSDCESNPDAGATENDADDCIFEMDS